MIFLPASFSTSVFGMQSILPASTGLPVFAIVISIVCAATYFLIVSIECTGRWKEKKRQMNMPDNVEQNRWRRWFTGRMTKKRKFADVEEGL